MNCQMVMFFLLMCCTCFLSHIITVDKNMICKDIVNPYYCIHDHLSVAAELQSDKTLFIRYCIMNVKISLIGFQLESEMIQVSSKNIPQKTQEAKGIERRCQFIIAVKSIFIQSVKFTHEFLHMGLLFDLSYAVRGRKKLTLFQNSLLFVSFKFMSALHHQCFFVYQGTKDLFPQKCFS